MRGIHFLPDQLLQECIYCKVGSRYHDLINTGVSHCHHFAPFYRVDRSIIAGHIPIVYWCSFLCTHYMGMAAHTQALTNEGALRPLACSYHKGLSGTKQAQITFGNHWHWQDGHPSKYSLGSWLLNFSDWSKDACT